MRIIREARCNKNMSQCVLCYSHEQLATINIGSTYIVVCLRCLKLKVPCSECKTLVPVNNNNNCKCCKKLLCRDHMEACHACEDCHFGHICCGVCQTNKTNIYRCELCHRKCHKITSMHVATEGCEAKRRLNLCCSCVPRGSLTSHTKPHVQCACGADLCGDTINRQCSQCKASLHIQVPGYTTVSFGCAATIATSVLQCCACKAVPFGSSLEYGKHIGPHHECKDCNESVCPMETAFYESCHQCTTPLHKKVKAYVKPSYGCKAVVAAEVYQCCHCRTLPPGYVLKSEHTKTHTDCTDCKEGICPDNTRAGFCLRCRKVKPHLFSIQCKINECQWCPTANFFHTVCCACYADDPTDTFSGRECRRNPHNGTERYHRCQASNVLCFKTICNIHSAVITKKAQHICPDHARYYPHQKAMPSDIHGRGIYQQGIFTHDNHPKNPKLSKVR